MPVTFSKIASNTASVTLHIGEDTVTVVYFPGHITEKSIAQMQSFSTMDESSLAVGFAGFNEMLAHLIKSWDVFEDDEQTVMFPLDPVRLAELPVGFRLDVITAIMGDIRPEVMAPHLNGHS
jgi:hypothetical protein